MTAYRWGVASRVIAAILGGYGLAALVAAICAASLPLSRAEATLTGMLLSLLVHAGAVIWVFSTASALRAWAGIIGPTAVLAIILLSRAG